MVSALRYKKPKDPASHIIGDLTIESKPTVKYLELMLDSTISFFAQIKEAADRAAAGVSALSRLMANVEALYLRGDVLFYRPEVWAAALEKEVHRKRLIQVER